MFSNFIIIVHGIPRTKFLINVAHASAPTASLYQNLFWGRLVGLGMQQKILLQCFAAFASCSFYLHIAGGMLNLSLMRVPTQSLFVTVISHILFPITMIAFGKQQTSIFTYWQRSAQNTLYIRCRQFNLFIPVIFPFSY